VTFFWHDLTARDFLELDAARTIAVLPIAATEQHGPHLPVSTDSTIAEGMLGRLREQLPEDISVLVLPSLQIGKSNEHMRSAGTLTLPSDVFEALLTEVGASVYRAGLRKLLIINSHGGNNPVMEIVARALRVRFEMLVVTTQWNRFGVPADTVDEAELRYGVHAGLVETSLMLAFRPDLVRFDKAQNFVSSTAWMEQSFSHLRATGRHNMGWIIEDLNAEGAVGNAAAATAELGMAIAKHQARGAIELLRDMTRFDLKRLEQPGKGPSLVATSDQSWKRGRELAG